MESDVRFYRRRANEEIAAANRAVTEAARERRMQLADAFLERLKAVEHEDRDGRMPEPRAFDWRRRERAIA